MRKGIMLCYPYDEKRLSKWEPPYIVQPKLDGERCRALWNNLTQTWELLSSEENVITSVPHLVESLNSSNIPRELELDGELYTHGKPFEEIQSIVGRTVSLSVDYDQMEYQLFDIVDLSKIQAERTKILAQLELPKGVYRVPFELCHSSDQIMKVFDKFIEASYEGIIVRHWLNIYKRARSIHVMKFKPKKEDIYLITGAEQMVSIHGELKPMIGSLICQGDDGTPFRVGSGMDDEFRTINWPNYQHLIGKYLRVKYQHITTNHVPRFPVFVEVIEEDNTVSLVNFLP